MTSKPIWQSWTFVFALVKAVLGVLVSNGVIDGGILGLTSEISGPIGGLILVDAAKDVALRAKTTRPVNFGGGS